MTYEIIIHGKPQSLEYFGVEQDREYMKSLYHPQEQPNQLVVDTRIIDGKPFCYYHYLVYANVVEYGTNRKGSYIGLTARFDNYCLEAKKVFSALEFIYRNHCIGSIVTERGGVTTFTIPNFSEVECRNRLVQIRSQAEQLFQGIFTAHSFVDLASSRIQSSASRQTFKLNTEECTEEEMMNIIQSGGSLMLSGAFPSQVFVQKEKSFQSAMEKVNSEHKSELSRREAQIQSLAKEQEQTKRQVALLSSEVEQYKNALREVEVSIGRLKSVTHKGTPSSALSSVASAQQTDESHSPKRTKSKGISTNLLLVICTLVIIIALLSSIFWMKSDISERHPAPSISTVHQTTKPQMVKHDQGEGLSVQP